MPRQENIDTVLRGVARLNAGDIEGYLQIYDRAVIFHGYGRQLPPGIAGLREYYTRLRQGFPDMRIQQEDMIAEDEKICRRFIFYGTHKGEYQGIAPTKNFVTVSGQMILHFRNGKCIEVWHQTDGVTFLTQLGALPSLSTTRR